ncbi:glycoside hydrolase family 5 protein [Sphingosinicella terrae]|uniref:glycoside hydrolase family 5 protein n=1 Tax=Sphingosinicella terrae TaxID=2172047 RepID=UPI000E0D84B2|nr:glycoside hydrolase family 5 protein [Sphingosinicella terrae]
MSTLRRLLAACLVVLALAGATMARAQTPVERHGQLRVEGNRILGADGRPAVLRGMSLFWSQWKGGFYNADAVRWLAEDWRVDVIRVAVAVEPGGYLAHPEREWRKAERAIEAAIGAGLYVIVDWHAHNPHPEAAAAFFERVAQRWGDRPNLMYETWNEPLPDHGWAEVVKPYHEAVIPRIRRHDPDNLVVAGVPSWTQDVDVAARDPLAFANVAYALHFYAGTHRQELRDKAQAALDAGAALFVSEWGTTNADGDGPVDVEESRRWWDFMAANQLSDLNWSINDKDESSAALRPGASRRGGWREGDLTESGRLVRARLRTLAR